MPSIKQNSQNLLEAITNGTLSPVESPAQAIPSLPAPPDSVDSRSPNNTPFLRAPIPSTFQTDTDSFRAMQKNNLPTTRIAPLPASLSSNAGAVAKSQIIIQQQTGSNGPLIEVNNLKTASQAILNFIGTGITSDSMGGIHFPASTSDDLTHGDPVWEYDPAYFILRDDFVNVFSTASFSTSGALTGLGQLGWNAVGSVNIGAQNMGGGEAGHWGQISWENNGTASNAGMMAMNTYGGSTTFYSGALPLFDYPGWKMTWIWKHDGGISSTGNFATTQKSFYAGLAGNWFPGLANVSARPDVFIGLRYDTSATPGTLTLSAAANASGGTTAYTGTITGGANGAYIGITFVVTGFTNAANNGAFLCTQSAGGTLTLANASGVSESHAATAAGGGLNDAFYTFEAVANQTYSNFARHNKQGATLVTNVAPAAGVWHRLDLVCNTAGQVTMTLDGSPTNSFTVSVPSLTVTGVAGSQTSLNNNIGRVNVATGTTGASGRPVWTGGSVVTVSGLTGGNTPNNGTWTLFANDSSSLWFDNIHANIGNNSAIATIVGYPAVTPYFAFGNDDTASPTADSMRVFADYFSFVWNPNLGPSAPGTPVATKARYW